MHLVIASGMSGAGKTQVLHTLEDQGYYCIDNLPLELFESAFETERLLKHQKIAIGIDIRSGKEYLKKLPEMVAKLKDRFKTDIIYLYAGKSVLIKRYDETRRKHPLSNSDTSLREAILEEYDLIAPIREIADIQIDTSTTNIYELASKIITSVCDTQHQSLSLMFQSFGFKYGTPRDSDYLFDVRCLPNPYWVPELREHTGLEKEVVDWLSSHEMVNSMENDLKQFIEKWIPEIIASQRAYLTISIGLHRWSSSICLFNRKTRQALWKYL
ncbi:Nucleotide-binding protein in ptsO 5'region [Nymphon striatum]|nr:Nucleotide-binding protein in ptsO 5'region [Nymphon striatum]